MKQFYPFTLLLLLTGCALQPPKPETVASLDRPAAASVDVGIDWSWRVIGDAAVRPVQVFSNDGQTFLQMRDRRPVVLLVAGEIVPYQKNWPYLVIPGTPEVIDIAADGFRAVAEYQGRPPVQQEQVVGVEASRIERVEAPLAQASGQDNRIERVRIQ